MKNNQYLLLVFSESISNKEILRRVKVAAIIFAPLR